MLLFRRRIAVVLVAFAAAVVVLVGPTTTQDAAQAFVPPPVVAAVFEGPASLVVANPAGMAVTAIAVLAWLAYDNRETLIPWAKNAWCFMAGCDDRPASNGPAVLSNHHVPPAAPWTWTSYQLSPGSSPEKVSIRADCYETPAGHTIQQTNSNLCNTYGTGGYTSVCKNTTTGDIRLNGAGTAGGVGFATNNTTSGQTPWPQPTGGNNTFSGTATGEAMLCKVGEKVIRAQWWNNSSSSHLGVTPGIYQNGATPIWDRLDSTCRNDATGQVITVTGTQDNTGSQNAQMPACPAGYTRIGFDTYAGVIGDTGGSTQMGHTDLPWNPQNNATYPECIDFAGNPKGCDLQVWVDNVKCQINAIGCWDWQTWGPAHPGRAQCKWGPYVMPLSDCDPIAELYRTGTVANNDGGGHWYSSDPSGNPSPYTGPNARPNPSEAPLPNPTNPPGTNPGGDPNNNGGADPDGTENCWAAAISWNPVDWVFVPIKCALTWAFVPEPSYMADTMDSVGGSFSTTGVGQWFGAFGSIISSTSGGGAGSCAGPE